MLEAVEENDKQNAGINGGRSVRAGTVLAVPPKCAVITSILRQQARCHAPNCRHCRSGLTHCSPVNIHLFPIHLIHSTLHGK